MDFSPRLSLPYLLPNQAQKHVTVNESLKLLDALVQLSVDSATLSSPPATPNEGEAYIVSTGTPSGDWATFTEGMIVCFQDGVWLGIAPKSGWAAYDKSQGVVLRFDGAAWQTESAGAGTVDGALQLGVNTTADSTNRLSVKSDAELLSHDDVTPGTGSARKIINKSTAGHSASLLFQSNWAGHAEFGLLGNNDFSIQVSSDGNTFKEALRCDADTGMISLPYGQRHAPSGSQTSQVLPVPGGDGVVSIFRLNAGRSKTPRSITISAISGDLINLSTPDARDIIEPSYMTGVSMVRIWNMSKSPNQSAWVVDSPNTSMLQVLSSTSVATWQAGENLQVGEPLDQIATNVIALDISPMMQNVFGAVFPQRGLIAKVACGPSGSVDCGLDLSSDGSNGSFIGTRGYSGEWSPTLQTTIPCSVPSPVSASNLVFLRENDFGGGIGIALASVNALLV